MNKRLVIVAAGAVSLAALLAVANHYSLPPVSVATLRLTRWIAILAIVLCAIKRRSLTTWILLSMIIGAELGHDWPGIAVNLRVLSLVFLRMIKTIIAPLLFATLVVGIAGHHDLKQVGRMGVKALVYFEVVTTIALFIGLAAINTSKAGVGVNLPPSAQTEQLNAVKQTPTDIILHIFPENVAK